MGLGNGQEVSRRSFLLTGFAGAAVGAGALWTPESTPVLESNGYDVFPGWIERNVKEKFIQGDGHFRWFREAVFNNSVVLETTKKFVSYLMLNWEKRSRVELGSSLAYSLYLAEKEIEDKRMSFAQNANSKLEALHVASFAFAVGFTGAWFSRKELRELGFNIGNESLGEYFWDKEKGLGTVVFPKLFGIDREEPETVDEKTKKVHFRGQDRTIHFAHHFLIAFMYMYSKYYGLPVHTSMPGLLRVRISIARNDSTQSDTILLSEILGKAYEFTRIFRGESLPIGKSGDEITDGLFDSMVDADYKGNRFGTVASIEAFKRVINNESLVPIYNELNDKRFSHFEEEPALFK